MKESTASLGAITIGLFAAFLLGLEITVSWAAQMLIPVAIVGGLMIEVFASLITALYNPKVSISMSLIMIVLLIFSIYSTLPLVKQ